MTINNLQTIKGTIANIETKQSKYDQYLELELTDKQKVLVFNNKRTPKDTSWNELKIGTEYEFTVYQGTHYKNILTQFKPIKLQLEPNKFSGEKEIYEKQ